MTALLRTGGWQPFEQRWSHDGGRTWSPPVTLEEGSVDADLETMSNGVPACSYGRPGSRLMFSTDGGKTWGGHQVITDEKGFNYMSVREVRPGRLLIQQRVAPSSQLLRGINVGGFLSCAALPLNEFRADGSLRFPLPQRSNTVRENSRRLPTDPASVEG